LCDERKFSADTIIDFTDAGHFGGGGGEGKIDGEMTQNE